MKIAFPTPIGHYFNLIILCLFTLIVFNSCEKDDMKEKVSVKGEAKIKFINASQNTTSIDFYMNNTKVNSSALGFGESSEYIKIEAGKRTTKVNQDIGVLEAESQFTYVPTLSYTSFYVEDKAGKGTVLTFEDNLGAIEGGKAKVRFINMSPYFSNSINVILSGEVLLVNSLPFKEASGYFLIEAGTDISVSVLGKGTIKLASGAAFEAGKNYTIWFGGSSNSTLSINKITYN